MKHVDIDSLEIKKEYIGYGSYSEVGYCIYKGERYAFKQFNDPERMFKSNFEEKLDELLKMNLTSSVVPEIILESCGKRVGYLTRKLSNSSCFSTTERINIYQTLLEIKQAIIELHDNNIVHGDIHSGNILNDDERHYLIDFDNCKVDTHRSFTPDIKMYSKPAKDFVKRKGVVTNLDIYMFNVLTFCELNGGFYKRSNINIKYRTAFDGISNGMYGVFKCKESKDICSQMCNFESKEFLIDTITEKDVKKYHKELTFK